MKEMDTKTQKIINSEIKKYNEGLNANKGHSPNSMMGNYIDVLSGTLIELEKVKIEVPHNTIEDIKKSVMVSIMFYDGSTQ